MDTIFYPQYLQGMDESLSMSLLERFDAMETEAGEPERRIGTVVMRRDSKVVTVVVVLVEGDWLGLALLSCRETPRWYIINDFATLSYQRINRNIHDNTNEE